MELSEDQVKRLKWWRNSTFLVMLFGYVGYYLVRQNLSAAFPLMEQAFGYSNADLGLIAASSEMAYAIGKFINGPLGDKIGGRRIFLLGMAGAILCNLVFAFGTSLLFLWWFGVSVVISCRWVGAGSPKRSVPGMNPKEMGPSWAGSRLTFNLAVRWLCG